MIDFLALGIGVAIVGSILFFIIFGLAFLYRLCKMSMSPLHQTQEDTLIEQDSKDDSEDDGLVLFDTHCSLRN